MSDEKNDIGFQQILVKLCEFWSNLGCVLIPPSQTEISSPMFHPISFFNMIGNNNFNFMYFQPHVASKEYKNVGFNIQNYSFLKFQVFLMSDIKFPQKVFLDSLEYLGLPIENNDIEFENKHFINSIFRINSRGYHIFFNSISILEINYIENLGLGNFDVIPIAITYDLDKIISILQNEKDIWNISWNGLTGNNKISYYDVMYNLEKGNYDFIRDDSTNDIIFKEFNNLKNKALILLEKNIIVPAYISILKAKYCLDILNYRNYISYNNKVIYNKELRNLVDLSCEKYNMRKKEN